MTAHEPDLVARVAHAMDADVFAHTTGSYLAAQAATVQDATGILDLLEGEGRLVDPTARRVILVSPGDVLLIGGLPANTAQETVRPMRDWFAALGIHATFWTCGVTINVDRDAAPDGVT